jgi:hypothetical protein
MRHHHTHIAITSPHTGDPVEGLIQVSGTLRPHRARLQVFVRSADYRWYQQWEPVKSGGKWRCKAQIGFLDDPHATDYMIAAIGGPPIEEKVREILEPLGLWEQVLAVDPGRLNALIESRSLSPDVEDALLASREEVRTQHALYLREAERARR